jgi:hypothetical protein
MTEQNLFFVCSSSGNDSESLALMNFLPNPPTYSDSMIPLAEPIELMNLPPNPPNYSDYGMPFEESLPPLMNLNLPPNHSPSDCGMPLAASPPTGNLPSGPPNRLDCGPPFPLRFEEPCFADKWSRDLMPAPGGLGKWGSFGNVGGAVLGLSSGSNDIYGPHGLGCARGLLTELRDCRHDFDPDAIGEQRYIDGTYPLHLYQ